MKKALTIEEAAQSLSVSYETLRRKIQLGEIPAFRLGQSGRQWRIFEEDLVQYAQSQYSRVAERPASDEAREV